MLFWTLIAHLVLSHAPQSCDINEEITRISIRESLKTELTLEKEIAALRSEMVQKETLLKKEIADLKAAMATVEQPSQQDKALLAKSMEDVAWQALHAAAAGACRGSTKTGGHGPWGNAVLPKLHNDSCKNVCSRTSYSSCDADVSILGSLGKATSYTQRVGSFYNYGCDTAGNQNEEFDEVKSDNHEIISENPYYFRYCCCRKP